MSITECAPWQISDNQTGEDHGGKRLIDRVPFTPGDLTDHQHGTDDILTGLPGSIPSTTDILIGDAGGSMFDHSEGGDDTIHRLAGSTRRSASVMRSVTCPTTVRAATIPLPALRGLSSNKYKYSDR